MMLFIITLFSCEDFVEIDTPNNKLVRSEVFNSNETAISAMTGIYNQLYMSSFSNGSRSSVTFLCGLSADNLSNLNTTNLPRMQFQENEIFPDNQHNLDLWASAYNIIYLTNSFLEGLKNSEGIELEVNLQLEGEAKFVRAFTYFYLTNLYGDVPLILTTNYRSNELEPRSPASEIYQQIENDLLSAIDLMGINYREGERTVANKSVATAFLARVYLYLEEWELAENYSKMLIEGDSMYEILDDPNAVFLANSKEAIWQLSPLGSGGIVSHTNEGNIFIIDPVLSFFATVKLTSNFLESLGSEDRRLIEWTSYNSSRDAAFPHKYKIRNSSEFPIEEYSMALRLAEQYLISSEAKARQGDLSGAIEDLNIIKNRAGTALISEESLGITRDELLEKIMEERRKELFTEWGHRWFDLKRTGQASAVLGDNPSWEDTDVFYPVPAEERMKNPNLSQNSGY